jgi:hypothetical protein
MNEEDIESIFQEYCNLAPLKVEHPYREEVPVEIEVQLGIYII